MCVYVFSVVLFRTLLFASLLCSAVELIELRKIDGLFGLSPNIRWLGRAAFRLLSIVAFFFLLSVFGWTSATVRLFCELSSWLSWLSFQPFIVFDRRAQCFHAANQCLLANQFRHRAKGRVCASKRRSKRERKRTGPEIAYLSS